MANGLDAPQFLNAREVPHILAQEQVHACRLPFSKKSCGLPHHRLGKSPEVPKSFPSGLIDWLRLADRLGGWVGTQDFPDAEGMLAIKEIPPEQAVTALFENVHPRTSRRQNPAMRAVGVEEPFQKRLPPLELVDFIKRHDRHPAAWSFQLRPRGHR